MGSSLGTELMTGPYAEAVGRAAYLWGWPLVNMHNRRSMMEMVPEPGLVGGFLPAAPLGRLGMLHDYITPDQRIVACPNQDVVYGLGLIDARQGPSVIQVPDFGDRFWVYQIVDERTDAFAELGKMYASKPGLYLLAPRAWDGDVPDGIERVFRFDTRLAACIPRVFMDDTAADRDAVQPLINQIMMYPLAEYTGRLQATDWRSAPIFPAPPQAGGGEQETQWVDPRAFFETLPDILREVPARPGEEALYSWFTALLEAAGTDPKLGDRLRRTAVATDRDVVAGLFQFRDIGIPSAHHWTTQRNGARFGTDYLSRTAMAKANIFVNTPQETAYYYQDLDASGERLDGGRAYTLTFPAGTIPPVHGFWSLTLYNQHHFFVRNQLDRYSLGTKNKDLRTADDGSLTLYVQARPPGDSRLHTNWLPAPADGPFSLYLRAYWPDQQILDGSWTPPPVMVAS